MVDKEKKDKYEVVEVATQKGLRVRDTSSDELVDMIELLVSTANTVEEMKGKLG